MSKRFGRNQKRKMRAQIAALQEAQAMDKGLSEHLGKKLAALKAEVEAWDRRIRALLGDESGYARTVVRRQMKLPGSYQFPIRQRYALDEGPYCGPADPMEMFKETMHKLEVAVRKDPVGHGRVLHLYAGHGNHLVYCMSETMIARLGLGEEGMRYVLQEAIREMDASMKNKEAA